MPPSGSNRWGPPLIDPKGNLVLDEARELVLLAPHVYQVIDGNRSIIESQFRLLVNIG